MILGEFGVEANHLRARTQKGGAVPEAGKVGPKDWGDRLTEEAAVQFPARDEAAQRGFSNIFRDIDWTNISRGGSLPA